MTALSGAASKRLDGARSWNGAAAGAAAETAASVRHTEPARDAAPAEREGAPSPDDATAPFRPPPPASSCNGGASSSNGGGDPEESGGGANAKPTGLRARASSRIFVPHVHWGPSTQGINREHSRHRPGSLMWSPDNLDPHARFWRRAEGALCGLLLGALVGGAAGVLLTLHFRSEL